MSNASEESRDAGLEPLVELGRNAARPPTPTELATGLTAVRARLAAARRPQRLLQRATLGIALVLAPLLWFYGNTWFTPELPALTYKVEGGGVLEGGYLRESGQQGISVRFNEGSRFVLTPGSRGRLKAVDNERARVGIEHGSAHVKVTPATGRSWEVEAGPFLVTVKGTAFTLSWDPANEQFELRLQRGRVVVSGPISGGELTLQSGQRLQVSLPEARTLITEDVASAGTDDARELRGSPPSASASSAVPASSAASDVNEAPAPSEPSAANEPPAMSPTSASSLNDKAPSLKGTAPEQTPASEQTARQAEGAAEQATKTPANRRWVQDLANGRWDAILADAERLGIAATLSSASSEDLFALANAARYRRRSNVAHDALQTLRRRYPQSPRALDALFLLGRVQEARGSGSAQALAWYDQYLTKAPNGAYAAEALGRKMTVVNKTADPRTARALAKDYLRRFPKGSHAGAARAILDER